MQKTDFLRICALHHKFGEIDPADDDDDEGEIDHQFLQHNLTPAAATATFTGLSDVGKRIGGKKPLKHSKQIWENELSDYR